MGFFDEPKKHPARCTVHYTSKATAEEGMNGPRCSLAYGHKGMHFHRPDGGGKSFSWKRTRKNSY